MASQQQQQPQPNPMVQPGLQQPSALQQLNQQQDFDPVHRFKMLIPQLKESLQVTRCLRLQPCTLTRVVLFVFVLLLCCFMLFCVVFLFRTS